MYVCIVKLISGVDSTKPLSFTIKVLSYPRVVWVNVSVKKKCTHLNIVWMTKINHSNMTAPETKNWVIVVVHFAQQEPDFLCKNRQREFILDWKINSREIVGFFIFKKFSIYRRELGTCRGYQ